MTDDAGEDGTIDESGGVEAAGAPAAGSDAPQVDLSLYRLSVSVRGGEDDDLDDVSAAARELMDYLSAKSAELEERPDDRGLG